jgi:hypothetical protein
MPKPLLSPKISVKPEILRIKLSRELTLRLASVRKRAERHQLDFPLHKQIEAFISVTVEQADAELSKVEVQK